jgi:hypothetical protein
MSIKEIIAGLFKPVADIFMKREERKQAREAATAKLAQAKQSDTQQLELNKDEWEAIAASGLDKTWRDEYVTVSVVSILNLIVIGGLAAAFGYSQILTGVGIALTAITTAGVDIGFLMEAAVLAGLGLSIWKRL